MTTYHVAKMRVVKPSDKMRAKHPDRLFTIFGTFTNEKGVAYTFTSKVIEKADAQHPEFAIDLVKGILTLHEGQRGRRESVSLSQDEVLAELAALQEAN